MAYTTQAQIETIIPSPDLIAALDDGLSGGMLNTALLATLIAQISTDIDGMLSSIYTVPFSGTPPPTVNAAATILSAEAIYQRRLTPEEKNPLKSQADMWRKRLVRISEGIDTLDASVARAFAPGVVVLECVSMDMTSA